MWLSSQHSNLSLKRHHHSYHFWCYKIKLDIKADGFWDCGQQSAFFDVKIFNPTAQTCHHKPLPHCYRRHKLEKRLHYEDRVLQVEHDSFTPLVFSTAGGFGSSATVVFKRLASLLATKHDTYYRKVMSWIRCKISFALIHSATMCLRGSRSHHTSFSLDFNFDLVLVEGQVIV